jgi:hypothetical protein
MKHKSKLGRSTLSTPKMTIRTQMPWPAKAAMWACAVAAGAVAAVFLFGLQDRLPPLPGLHAAGQQGQADLGEQLNQLTTERDRLQTAANAAEARLNIERAAQQQLARQVKALERDNIRLKEDLAFYDSLLPTTVGPEGLSIRRFTADMPAPNQVRYQALIMQGGKGQQEFLGNLQLVLTVTQAGKPAMMVFPEAKNPDGDKQFKLRFKHYQRLEGVLTLPDGVTVKSVQARVLERGQTRAQQAVNL